VFYESGESRKNFSHASGMKDSSDRQPPFYPSTRQLPTAFSGHPGRHNVATETRERTAQPTQPADTQPLIFNEQIRRTARMRLLRPAAPIHAAFFITSPA
jgi:hypothetical protein